MKYRHIKTGGLYDILHLGVDEATRRSVVIYQGEDGIVWVRPATEFFDGRFELAPKANGTQDYLQASPLEDE